MMIAMQLISSKAKSLSLSQSCDMALSLGEELGVVVLPVIEDGIYQGFLDLTTLSDINPHTLLSDIELQKYKSVSSNAHFFEIIGAFAETKSNELAVTDPDGIYLGVITLEKFIQATAKINAVWSPGGVVVLEIHPSDFHLSEIAQIAESNDSSILAMFIYPSSTGATNDVVLKFNKDDLDSVLSSFDRYAYNVKTVSTANQPDEDLLERYNSLMNYLNI